jgi:hypothetical protein
MTGYILRHLTNLRRFAGESFIEKPPTFVVGG